MFIWLAAGFGLLALLLVLGEKSANTDTVKLANQLRLAGGIGSLALAAFFIITGRIVPGLALGGAGLALLARRRRRLDDAPASGRHGDGRTKPGHNQQRTTSQINVGRAEAVLLLGLEEPFTDDDVRAAHRKLMLKHHPDQGGDTALAAKLNAAKSLLLHD